MATLKLLSGNEIPQVGFGTYDNTDTAEITNSINTAIQNGYRHIDCAWLYQNESIIGDTLKSNIEKGVVKREDMFITSKLWSTFHQPEDVRPAFMESLNALKLKYLDLYLMHAPCGFKKLDSRNPWPEIPNGNGEIISDTIDYVDTWKEMLKLVDEGLVKQVGVSNFNITQLKRVIEESGTTPAVNQIEVHPNLPQHDLVKFCHDHGIVITAYAPLGAPGRFWAVEGQVSALKDPKVLDIAKKHNKNAGQVILRYLIQRGLSVIPKSATESRIKGNIQVFDFKLTEEETKAIAELEKNEMRHFWSPNDVDFPFKTTNVKYFPFPNGEYKE